MKAATITIAIVIVIAAVVITAATSIYPATMTVVEVDRLNDEVTLETFTGHVYVMAGAEDWMEGNIASVLMFGRGTKTVVDDIILSARFSGWVNDDYC